MWKGGQDECLGTRYQSVIGKDRYNLNTPLKKMHCRNCDQVGHGSSSGKGEKACPAWDKKCDSCWKEAHYKVCCKSGKKQSTTMTNIEVTESEVMSRGALAAIMSMRKAMGKATGFKVQHMLYGQLRWIKKNPPSHPLINLSVILSVNGCQENDFKPPQATRRRATDMSCLADTGCQACCMGMK